MPICALVSVSNVMVHNKSVMMDGLAVQMSNSVLAIVWCSTCGTELHRFSSNIEDHWALQVC